VSSGSAQPEPEPEPGPEPEPEPEQQPPIPVAPSKPAMATLDDIQASIGSHGGGGRVAPLWALTRLGAASSYDAQSGVPWCAAPAGMPPPPPEQRMLVPAREWLGSSSSGSGGGGGGGAQHAGAGAAARIGGSGGGGRRASSMLSSRGRTRAPDPSLWLSAAPGHHGDDSQSHDSHSQLQFHGSVVEPFEEVEKVGVGMALAALRCGL
jgi:hypothetical protein